MRKSQRISDASAEPVDVPPGEDRLVQLGLDLVSKMGIRFGALAEEHRHDLYTTTLRAKRD